MHENHLRVKRWIQDSRPHSQSEYYYPKSQEPNINLKFSAHSRNFNIRLKRDVSVFGEHFHLKLKPETGESLPFAQNVHLFEGELSGK